MKRFEDDKETDHLLNPEKSQHSSQYTKDTKQLLKLIIISTTTPMYWALYGQQVSYNSDNFFQSSINCYCCIFYLFTFTK